MVTSTATHADIDTARRQLSAMPMLYVNLRCAVSLLPGRPLSDRVRTNRPGSRTPDNSPANDAADLLLATLTTWSAYCAALAHEAMPYTYVHGREGVRLQRSVMYLQSYGHRLLRDHDLAESYRSDLRIATHVARRVLFQDNPTARLPAPCPRCNRPALRRHNGTDNVVCGACSSIWPATQYHLLCRVLVEEMTDGT